MKNIIMIKKSNARILLVIFGLAIFLLGIILITRKLNQPDSNFDNRASASGLTYDFRLYTRVTPTTWPQIQPFARFGDLFWGPVDSVPTEMRALTFSNYAALVARLTEAQANRFRSVNLDGEYRDFEQAYTETKQIRLFIDNFNRRHQNYPGFIPLKFVAFFNLRIIDTHPDIVFFPDEVVVGKTNWTPENIITASTPYINQIKSFGKIPVILLSDKKSIRSEREKVPNSNEEVLASFHKVIDPAPAGLGLNNVSYYYDNDNVSQLLFTLRFLRR